MSNENETITKPIGDPYMTVPSSDVPSDLAKTSLDLAATAKKAAQAAVGGKGMTLDHIAVCHAAIRCLADLQEATRVDRQASIGQFEEAVRKAEARYGRVRAPTERSDSMTGTG